jgi:class 3 adenylate cyclase
MVATVTRLIGTRRRQRPGVDEAFDAQIAQHVNRVLRTGSLLSTWMGFGCAAAIALLLALGAVRDLELPVWFAISGGAYSLLFHLLARRNLLRRGPALRAAFVPFLLQPTLFLLAAHLIYPAGAATFITGPMSYLPFFLILLTAFTFDAWLCVIAGVLTAAGYTSTFVLAMPALAELRGPDPIMVQDLVAAPIYAFKSATMLAAGLLAALLTRYARTLVRRIVAEERERGMVERLFGEYVSDAVRDQIVGARAGLAGEKKEVTVLFSDIRGFSSISERTPPEQIVARLNEYFDHMVDAITANGGVIDKFVGDAIMGVFGGLGALPSSPRSAFEAALEMQVRLAQLNAQWARAGIPPFRTGIGLHVGEVVQGPIGSARRKDFTVIGDAVNTASRVEGLCKDHDVPLVITRAVYERLDDHQRARCVSIGSVRVKGKNEPVEIFGVPLHAAAAA